MYRTILVHLSDSRRAEAVLEPAVELAARYNSHLLGMHVYSGIPAPPVPALAPSVLGAALAQERKNGEEIGATFARLTAGKTLVPEWHLLRLPHVNLPSAVLQYGRTADLIVAGQTDPDWDMAPLLNFPEQLVMSSGRPVLVVPYAGRFARVGRNIMVAWKPTRESARAVFDALPLLRQAEKVHILEVRERKDDANLTPDTSIAAALARHGIKPAIHSTLAPDITIGDEILSRLSDLDIDLLVMGAYGHSRMREIVFGGATRHIARHMTVPTLFSH